MEYLDLPQEPPAIIESNRPPAYWPSSSGPNSDTLLRVEELVIRYAPDLPPVLHSVSFSIKARERVGLLGRTGSGKLNGLLRQGLHVPEKVACEMVKRFGKIRLESSRVYVARPDVLEACD